MLKKITSNDPIQRLNLSLHTSTLDLLQAYRDSYKATYGDELPQNLAIETMLTEFMAGDKDFQKYLKSISKPKTSNPRPAAPNSGFENTPSHSSDVDPLLGGNF